MYTLRESRSATPLPTTMIRATKTSLVAAGSLVPSFIARTAWAARPAEDNILVVLEMAGGNQPYAEDSA